MNHKIIPQDLTIETARCLLRCSSVEDIPSIFEATRVPEFHKGMESESPETIEQLYDALTENSLAWDAGNSIVLPSPIPLQIAYSDALVSIKTSEWVCGIWVFGRIQHIKGKAT